jgi:glycosyltransferase involved in cell wall biosynthesis
VLYNSIADAVTDVEKRISAKLSEQKLRIVFPGGRSSYKGPYTVTRVANHLANSDINWELAWLGSPGIYEKLVSKRARERIVFHGQLQRTEAVREIQSAHCFILPSKGEGCPMSLVEAMSAGVIALVSDCPSAMKEVVQHRISGFVAPVGASAEFANHLIEVGKSKDLMKSLMFESRKAFEKLLSFKIWQDKMSKALNKSSSLSNVGQETDKYDPHKVLRWSRRPGNWWWPTPTYLRLRLGLPNLSPISPNYSS